MALNLYSTMRFILNNFFIYRIFSRKHSLNSCITHYLFYRCSFCFLAAISLFFLLHTPVIAQKNIFLRSKSKKEKAKKNTYITRFLPSGSVKSYQESHFTFPNINVIAHYKSTTDLANIRRLSRNKQWAELHESLYEYINNFGIQNFLSEQGTDLLWRFARLSEYLNKISLTKEVYRLLIKHYRGDLQNALNHYDSLIQFEKDLYVDLAYYYELVERRRAIDTLKPPPGVLLNMGQLINSEYADYAPAVSGESDDLIIFSSDRNRDTSRINVDLGYSWENEDIYRAKRDEDGIWMQAEPFESVNSSYNEGSPCMSRDRKTLLFVRCSDPKGLGNCDIYQAALQEDGKWSEAVNLGENINGNTWDSHPSFSTTGDTLYFASDRKGGFGGSDIYFAVKGKGGKWGKAKNIGPTINTRSSELSPHYHPNHNVLYFSSNGHLLNFGDFDIFKVYFVNNQWTEPKNVGPLVNTKGREYYFSIDASSKWLYYAKTGEEDNNLDLYSFPLPMEANPRSLIRFSGKVREPITGEIFSGIVTIIDVDENVEVAPKYLRPDGSFGFDLIDGRNYLLVIEGDNFFKIEELFSLNGSTESEVLAMSASGVITFESIDFEAGSSKLLPKMENNLHLVIDFLVLHPNFHLKVIGHTSSEGSLEFNMKLSQERADVIKKYIISYGNLSPERIEAKGVGGTMPIIKEEQTEVHKKLNRRVEFVLFRY